MECNPIVVSGTLYATTPRLRVVALDAAIGEEQWVFDPFEEVEDPPVHVNRGVTYWEDGEDRRILFTVDSYLYALDAASGRPISTFGSEGRVDLREGLGRDVSGLRVTATSPGVIYEDLYVLGSSLGEGPGPAAPGHVRAYDVRTGERTWTFRTVPRPGAFGHETWPEGAWKRAGGVNAWGGMSLDRDRGHLFVPTGSPTYDHHGGDRHGKNLFANSVLALDAESGERIWHYQTVHHDVWDYDLPTAPSLITLRRDGDRVEALAQPTKMGHLFVLDRSTGEPLFPVEERPVPPSTVPGEKTWPTQPIPTRPPPYADQGFDSTDVTDRSPEARDAVLGYLDRYGPSRLFSPPDTTGTIVQPQFNGGTNWGGAAVDPTSGMLYVNASNVPELITMVPASSGAGHPYPYVDTGHQPIRDPDGYPISDPPWGTLSALDLNAGTIEWQVSLGTHPELAERYERPTGTFNIGGPAVTAGGLVFIAATTDERIRAFDSATGNVLWQAELPAGGYATPSVYETDGRQYVVIAAGGAGKPGTTPGHTYVAFALSDEDPPDRRLSAVGTPP